MGIGIQGELLADEGSCFFVDATIVCGCLMHGAMGTSRTDRMCWEKEEIQRTTVYLLISLGALECG